MCPNTKKESRSAVERNTLYRRIAQQLIERISSGNLKPGDRLPGEYQLAKDFHVGRSTIRDALRLLQESEYIEVRNGVGSFVAAPQRAIANPLTLLTSIGTMIEASGFKASAHIEWVRHQQPEAAWSQKLCLNPGEAVVVMGRKRFAGRRCVSFAVNIFSESLVGKKMDQGFEGSIFHYLEENWNISPQYAITRIHAMNKELPWDAMANEILQEPAIMLEQLHYDQNYYPVFLSRNYVQTDFVALQLIQKRVD